MITVVAGTETYGAVRKVASTPIVTKFAMLQFIPLYPLESYYLKRLGKDSFRGIPLIASATSRSIVGLRLARVDRLSVAIAYVRAFAGILGLPGFTIMVIAIVAMLTGSLNPQDSFQRSILPVATGMLCVGALIGLPTYYATYVVDGRERRIREVCDEILGIAADPAMVDPDTAGELMSHIKEALSKADVKEPTKLLRNPQLASREQAGLLLVACRLRIATGGDRDKLEQAVDDLLRVV